MTPNPNPNQVTGEAQDDEAKPAPRPVAASLGGGDEEPKTFEEALYAGIGAVVAMFHRFDPNGTEEVDRADFRKTLGAVLPGNFGSDDFDDLFVRFEVDQRGKVNYEDFNRLVRKEYHASLKANRAAVKGPDEAEKKPPARPWRRAAETTTPTLPLPLPLNLTNGTGLALGLAQLVLKVLYPSFEVRVRKDSPSDDDGASDTGSDAVLLASCA